MIEQPVGEPYPDGTLLVITEGDIARIYFAEDNECITHTECMMQAVKYEAKEKIKRQCESEILSGVDSSATGTVKNYRTTRDDQSNVTSAVSANVGSTVTQDGVKVILNAGQTVILNFDIVERREILLGEKETRKSEVDSALTEQDIQDIVDRVWV